MKNKAINNASWIIGCKVAQSVLALVIHMISSRYLGPSNYGLISYAASLVAFVLPVADLGLNSILVREIVVDPEREGEALGSSLAVSLLSGAVCMAGIMSFVAIANAGERDTFIVCSLYSIYVLAAAASKIQYWFQAKLLSKYPSIAALVSYLIKTAYQIFLLATGKSVYWFAVTNALDILILDAFMFLLYIRLGKGRLSFSFARVKALFAASRYYILSDIMIVIFAETDRIMLKMMLSNAATGYYSAAVVCAGMTNFVFAAILDSFRPVILETHGTDPQGFDRKMVQLYFAITYLALAQSVAMTLFAPLIIGIIYGGNYAPSINALRIVVWYTTFSYLGAARNIWVLANGKQKILWKINVVGAASNVALNYVLISVMGVNGAALASLLTQFITNIVTCFLFDEIKPTVKYLAKGLNPKVGVQMLRRLRADR